MTSITSIISLAVLLMATYCYSVPVGQNFDFSTSNYHLTTEKTMIEREGELELEFTTYDTPTSTKYVHQQKRTFDDSDSDEHTTSFPVHIKAHEHHKRHNDEDFLFTTSAIDSVSEEPHHVRRSDDYLFTTMDSSAKFNARAIPSENNVEDEDQERRAQPESDLEMTTFVESSASVKPEPFTFHPTTSSFERKLYTVEPETNTYESSSSVNSVVEPTEYHRDGMIPETSTPWEINRQPLVHTETIIPGQITETKVFDNVPSRTYLANEAIPVQQSQLSQGSTLLLFLLAALLFCAFLLATTIAVVKLGYSLKRKSQINEMEADLDKPYDRLRK